MNTQRGFTLTELIITMVIASILAAVAVPAYQDFMRSTRMSTTANEVIAAFNYARSEAIKRNRRVTICKSNNKATCTSSAEWHHGWIIFAEDLTFNSDYDTGETMLRIQGKLKNDLQLDPIASGTIFNALSFTARGQGSVAGVTTTTVTMSLCDDKGIDEARAIVVSRTGRVNVVKGTAASPLSGIIGSCPTPCGGVCP
jgi:type IV fimbrial biogenesis protein FimT